MTETRTAMDLMDPARISALFATLGIAGDAATVPPFAHHIYFWDAQPPAALGRDGHPATGDFIPDMGLPRRMWAGGRLSFHAPLATGRPAERRSTVASAVRKTGRTGPLAFVTLRHEIVQDGTLCLVEEQDLVYREADAPAATPERCEAVAPERHPTDTTLLFRYSALTFNGHRIHYDRDYARAVEGYPDLVVHGPILAQLLALRAERTLGRLETFSFRARAPIFCGEQIETCAEAEGDTLRLWVRGPDGRLAMQADAA
ncbi:MaoC family dehydratase N-terminal domain-containing protein [Roseobacter sp. HKCCA0434]|uniref:FAS1-like dehydratase domain-containing protein n=1 Tax=Roseobacter sp. HKCCA0434 TaxID=3079297 RepID=UPI002905BBC8|nr:MaoC family dehydratase N-terminal domain-containing protein [Roseobacter sp. HKCCA0434]